jgi:hypothetical protein
MADQNRDPGLDADDSASESLTADALLTVPEVAAILRVPSSWVYSHATELGVYRVGKYLRFEREIVLEEIRKRSRGG